MIVDYWGRVLQRVPRGRGCAVAEVDAARQAGVRESFPALAHRAFSDADLSTPLEELPRLRFHLEGNCQVAIASRAGDAQIEVHQALRRELMGKTYNKLLQLLVLPGIRDSQCGFKVFTATAAEACFGPLQTQRFGFDAEVLLRARRHGWRIAEVPVRWRHVEASRVHPLRDASRMLLDLVLLRLRRLQPEPGVETGRLRR
jgi:dolichyl-phosphate beta-glucosyltransferase